MGLGGGCFCSRTIKWIAGSKRGSVPMMLLTATPRMWAKKSVSVAVLILASLLFICAPTAGSGPARRHPASSTADRTPSSPPPDLSFLAGKLQETSTSKGSQQSMRVEIGEWAQSVRPVVSESQFVASYTRQFPDKEWPSRVYECTSVDTADGSLHVWNASSGVPVAVASSCPHCDLVAVRDNILDA